MGAWGKKGGRLLAGGSAAVRTDVRCALPGRRLPEFLVLDVCLRASVRHHSFLAPGLRASAGQLLLHTALHVVALGNRWGGPFDGVLESGCPPPCCICVRA